MTVTQAQKKLENLAQLHTVDNSLRRHRLLVAIEKIFKDFLGTTKKRKSAQMNSNDWLILKASIETAYEQLRQGIIRQEGRLLPGLVMEIDYQEGWLIGVVLQLQVTVQPKGQTG